ncbi:MAG: KdsC family phosphatase [Acidobacteriota bacterium]
MDLGPEARTRATRIRFLLLDVDGVLTDGRLLFDPGHPEDAGKAFHVRDGLGIRLAQAAGIDIGLLSGRDSAVVSRRARDLDIDEVHLGVGTVKLPAYLALKDRLALPDDTFCYIGDDLVDLPILRRVGWPATVADAHPEVLRHALVTGTLPGGAGAVREIIEALLDAQGTWERAVNRVIEGVR